MFYHGGQIWLPGGFLGVDVFFTLSGFLITTLLIQELRHRSSIRLASFWARRARRLLPALVVAVALCAVVVWVVARPGTYPAFKSDAISTLFYVANWHFIAQGGNYFISTSAPSLLTHTWSLAIEEQFYVFWPLVLVVLWKLGRGVGTLLVVTVTGAVASTLWMAYLFHHGASLTRLYFGTDTHLQCLMVGAALAATLRIIAERSRPDGPADIGRLAIRSGPGKAGARSLRARSIDGFGIAGVLVGAAMWTLVSWSGAFLYQGGFLLMAFATAAVIVAVSVHRTGLVARALSVAPLVFVGRISYGLYLWHFPIFQVIDRERTGLGGLALLSVRFALTFALSIASFFLLERPVRHSLSLKGWRTPVVAVAAFGTSIALVFAASASAYQALPTTTHLSVSAAGHHDPIRILLVGDSVGLTLGFPLSYTRYLDRYNASLQVQAFIGCGLTLAEQKPPECDLPRPPDVADVVQRDVAMINDRRPEVVVVVEGRWETFDENQNGADVNIFDPAFRRQITDALQQVVDSARANQAQVVLFTAPCYAPQYTAQGLEYPANEPERVALYNDIVRSVAAANPETVRVFDFNRLVCPGGSFQASLDGTVIRGADGVHIQLNAWDFFDPRIYPTLVAAGLTARHDQAVQKGLPQRAK
jgi:peptidoglycan/LPS O-acetylase OafA/YrhL